MPCSNCGKDQIMAKGLCNACYIRQYRFGTLEPKEKKEIKPRKPKNDRPCINCGTVPVAAHELCAKCYGRMLKFGHVSSPRPVNYGKVGKHPLRESWRWLIRSIAAKNTTICEEWKGNIEKFAEDVGERPSKQHILKRIDESKGYEPGNVYWHEKVVLKNKSESYREYQCRSQKMYRLNCPQNVKSSSLKKTYGIDIHEYNRMLEQQGSVCAVCGEKETSYDHRGALRMLHVDHCHSTGKIRSLLCSKCNNGLGCFQDDIERMQKAIEYLRSHGI
jgi:hypothetical protein